MRPLFLVPIAFAASLAAQTQVVPADFATVEAPSSTNFPFGLSSAARVQYLYGAQETGLVFPMFVQSLNLRANGTSTNLAKSGISLQISLSTTTATVGTASTTFANNHGANLVVAYTRKPTNLAATTPQSPGQYGGPFVLDTPFVYDPGTGNLLIDFDVASQPAGSWPMDTPYTTAGVHATVGTACGSVSATSSGGALGGTLVTSMSGGVANNPGVVLAGFMQWPSPIPIPGTTNCFLYQDVVASASVALSATGTASLTLAVPPDATLRGVVVYTQWAAINAAFGLDMSQSRRSTLSSWVVLRVHNTTSNTSGTGTVQNYAGIVIELS